MLFKDKNFTITDMSAIRLPEILKLARSAGVITVDDLTERFDVTPQTIRKDLNQL